MRQRWVLSVTLLLAAPAHAAWVAPGRVAWPAGGPVRYERQPYPAAAERPDGTVILSTVDRDHIDVRHLLGDGTVDPAFGTGGVTRLELPVGTTSAQGLPILQDGGRILVCVGVQKRVKGSGFVRALAADGTPDPSYGNAGRAAVPFFPYDIAEGIGGAVLFVGQARHRPVVARLTAYGAADTTLGTDGVRVVPGLTGRDASADEVTALGDGRLVVLGRRGRATTAVVRLRPEGTPDPEFNGGQPVVPHVRSAEVLATLSDGTTAVAGTDAIARITPAGALDPTFGTHGRVDTGPADNGEYWHLRTVGDTIYAWRPRAYPPLPASRPNLDLHTLDTGGLSPARPVQLPFAGGQVLGGRQDSFESNQLLPRSSGGWLAVGSTKLIEATGSDAGYEETATFQTALAALTPDLALDESFGGAPTALSCSISRITLLQPAPPYRASLRLAFASTVPGLADVDIRAIKRAVDIRGQVAAFVAGRNAGSPLFPRATNAERLHHGEQVRVRLRVEDIFGRRATCVAPLRLR